MWSEAGLASRCCAQPSLNPCRGSRGIVKLPAHRTDSGHGARGRNRVYVVKRRPAPSSRAFAYFELNEGFVEFNEGFVLRAIRRCVTQ
jgi:hypothetical protein